MPKEIFRERDGNDGLSVEQIREQIKVLKLTNCPPWPEKLTEDLQALNEARLAYQGLVLTLHPISSSFGEDSYSSTARRQASQNAEVEKLLKDYGWVKGSWATKNPLPFLSLKEARAKFLAAKESYEHLLKHAQTCIGEILQAAQVPEEKAISLIETAALQAVVALKLGDQNRFPQICQERLVNFLENGSPSSDLKPPPSDQKPLKRAKRAKNQEMIMDFLTEHPKSSPGDAALQLGLKLDQVHRAAAALRRKGYVLPWGNQPTIEERVPLAQ